MEPDPLRYNFSAAREPEALTEEFSQYMQNKCFRLPRVLRLIERILFMRLARFMRSSEIFAVTGMVVLAALLAQVGPAQQGKTRRKLQPNRPASRRAIGRSTAAILQATVFAAHSDQYTQRRAAEAGLDISAILLLRQRPTTEKAAPKEKGKGKGGAPGLVAESTPIVINGVMYVAGGNRVFALDADSGKESWSVHRAWQASRIAPSAIGPATETIPRGFSSPREPR